MLDSQVDVVTVVNLVDSLPDLLGVLCNMLILLIFLLCVAWDQSYMLLMKVVMYD